MTRRRLTVIAILTGLGAVAALAVARGAGLGGGEPGASAASGGAASGAPAVEYSEREMKRILGHSPLPALPPDPTNAVADDPEAARLGQFLFFDTRLSANGMVSCATCHDPEQSFTDGLQKGNGLDEVDRNTMSLWNVAYNRWFFWDGRADTLWLQALHPIEDAREHGISRLQALHHVHDDPALRAAYEAIFGPMPDLADRARFPAAGRPVPDDPAHAHHVAWSGMTDADRAAVDRAYANLGKAIAAYQRRLVSRRSAFDVFVEGLRTSDAEAIAALDPAAQRGLKLFAGRANCELCHFGPNFTDGEFHSTGVPPLGGGPLRDAGRYEGVERLLHDPFNAAGAHADATGAAAAEAAEKVRSLVRSTESWGQFKTPSLRNVAGSAPYMHHGQYESLEEVVRHYSTLEDAVLPSHHREQLLVPLNLTERESADLVAFLLSLTDEGVDPRLLVAPDAPGAPAATPK